MSGFSEKKQKQKNLCYNSFFMCVFFSPLATLRTIVSVLKCAVRDHLTVTLDLLPPQYVYFVSVQTTKKKQTQDFTFSFQINVVDKAQQMLVRYLVTSLVK